MSETTKRYFNWFNTGLGSVRSAFEKGEYDCETGECKKLELEGFPTDEQVVFASYDGDYDGHAVVLFERDGKLLEVQGSHCSCNGLEGDWKPNEVTWDALKLRLDEIEREKAHGYNWGFLHQHGEGAQDAFIELVKSRV